MSFWDWFRPKPKPPTTTACYVTVCTVDRQLVPNLHATLEIETHPGVFLLGTQEPERVKFLVPSSQIGHGAYLRLNATPTYPYYTERLAALPDMGEVILQAVPTLGALAVSGHVLTAAGQPFSVIEASSFRSLDLFLRGELGALDEHLSQLHELGFNTHRWFGMCRNLFDLDPETRPHFYDQLPRYVEFAAQRGLYTDVPIFPDVALIHPDLSWQLGHWAACGEALRPVSSLIALVSLQNEVDQAPNLMNFAAFDKLDGLLCSRGSRGSRGAPVRPWWDIEEYHTNEEQQFWREPHNAMEFSQGDSDGTIQPSHVPMLITESRRPDRDPVASHFYDYAECAALLIAGNCFHSIPGRTSLLLTGYDLECAHHFVAGAKSMALACQIAGPYHQRRDLEKHVNCPAATGGPCTCGERAYQRGFDDACIAHSLD